MILFATLLLLPLVTVDAVGTLTLLDYPSRQICLHRPDNRLSINEISSNDCLRLEINVHHYEHNIVISFLNAKRVCSYMCINKCGEVYYDSVFHTQDCRLTTAAFDGIETLSVHRGNYSDFVATHDFYNFVPVSFKEGDTIERQHSGMVFKYTALSTQQTCALSLTPLMTTKKCTVSTHRYDTEYKPRRHYKDYSLWRKLLILIGVVEYKVPDEKQTLLSYTEYTNE
uniref:FGF-1 n=1 Tax=Cydia pomonella granulosis virus TaxID=28289 RepID=A0A097P0Q8_GVCP|nr:ORF76 FGF-1 [Cydia pomonella granulovirus]AIU36859.1 ORF76 FGF-1 [Cydia pomonella granulovirus]AIU37283.1 ORF76 FGF-1 [Cydia pomonella granulovirus]QDW81135.1 FGF-1 [Cydia pomonella granulovirus]QGY99466.1 FGF-1 [Cydia pomonella granulovirus]